MSISQMTMDFFPFKYICCSFLTDKLLTSMYSLYNVQCLIRNRNCSLSSTWFTRSVLSGTETDGTDPWRAHGSPTVFYQEHELILGEHMVHLLCFTRNRNWSLASTWFTCCVLPGTGTEPSRAHGSPAVLYQEQELILGEHMVHLLCFTRNRNWSFASTWFTCCVLSGTGTDPSRAHGSPAVFYQEQELILREQMVHTLFFSGKELILREHMVHTQCFCGVRGFFYCLSCGFVIIVFVLCRMSFCFLCRSFK